MNGWLYDAITLWSERRIVGPIRTRLLSQLEGAIVEIGAGTGASFWYYGSSAHVRAIEPDASMLARAEKRAMSARAKIDIVRGDDTLLDTLAPESFDHAVASLVLCSVENPLRTLERVRRVLKPHGSLVMIEHVRAENRRARTQDRLTPLWRHIAGNCHLNRVLEPALSNAGFSEIDLQSRTVPIPMWRLLYGTARTAST